MTSRKLAIPLLLVAVLGAAALALLGVRGVKGEVEPGPGAPVGLMTSLPIYWADGADIASIAQQDAARPWTRTALELDYELLPIDTLVPAAESEAPLPGLEMPESAMNGIEGLERLAIIQPRGLSPQDNVALDQWVREGGRLLMVLDPLLSGHYETPIFDPRHPTSSALIPPVVQRWGLAVSFDDTQPLELRVVEARHGPLPVVMAGEISIADPGAAQCSLDAENIIAHCDVEEGSVMLIADAALFEAHDPGEEGSDLVRLLVREALE